MTRTSLVLRLALGLVVLPAIVHAQSLPTFSYDGDKTPQVNTGPMPMVACTFVINGTLGSGSPDRAFTTGMQTGRLFRGGIPSSCAAPLVCGVFDSSPGRFYDAYEFNNETAAAACVNLSFDVVNQQACAMGVVTYLGSYNPASVCTNYLADLGISLLNGNAMMSFTVPANTHFVVVVYGANIGASGCPYKITMDGDICQVTPTHQRHWGDIKVLYR